VGRFLRRFITRALAQSEERARLAATEETAQQRLEARAAHDAVLEEATPRLAPKPRRSQRRSAAPRRAR